MKKRKLSRKQTFGRVAVIVLLLALVAAAVVALHIWESGKFKPEGEYEDYYVTEKEKQMIRHNGQWYELNDNIETVLLIGLDKFEEDIDTSEYNFTNNQRADFMMLAAIDKEKQTVSVIHINRDTIGDIRVLGVAGQVISTTKAQLALSYNYGSGGHDSCRNTMYAVSSYFYDLPIDHYITVTMDAVGILNDLVDGVTLTVMDDFSDLYPEMTQGATVTLNSEQALSYVRARSSLEDPTNAHRMVRQRQYLEALYGFVSARMNEDSDFAVNTILKLSKYMLSDCSASALSDIINYAHDFEIEPIYTIEGESTVGEKFMEFYPDEDKFKDLIVNVFYIPGDNSPADN